MASAFMTVRTRSLTLLAAGCLASVILTGCEDPAMEKQRAFERQFNEVAASYSSTLGAHPDLFGGSPTDESLAALRGVADRAKSLSGGTPGQTAAARGLAASVYRTAGAVALSRAMALESGIANDARLALGYAEIAADLDALANAAENLDLAEARSGSSSMRDAAARGARAAQESLRGLEGPAAQLEASATRGAARLRELGQEAAVLVRKARELTPAAGLEFVEQAAGVRAEARTVALTTANQQSEADKLRGDASVEQAKLQASQTLQAAADKALELINNFDADIDGRAKQARDMAAEMRGQADALLRSIADVRNGALKAAYEAAAGDFSNCANESDSDSLRFAVTAEEVRLAVSSLEGFVLHGRTVSAVRGKAATELADIKRIAGELQGALKEKATAASDMFANMGEDPTYASLKAAADAAKQFAETSLDTLMAPPQMIESDAGAMTAGAKSSGRSMASSGAGVDDIEAFVSRLNDSDPATSAEMMLSVMDDSTAGGKAMKGMTSSMLAATGDLLKALHEKWGDEGLAALGGGMGGAAGGGMALGGGGSQRLTKKSIDGDRAVFTAEDGTEIVFNKTGSGWKTDLTSTMDPEQLEQIKQMGPMMSMLMAPLGKASKAIAARIRAGEFDSPEDVQAALAEEMSKGMGGGFGGFGG
ncbi:MAG: hypothetical protein RLZZ238_2094 [Planctomycetota bacterium]